MNYLNLCQPRRPRTAAKRYPLHCDHCGSRLDDNAITFFGWLSREGSVVMRRIEFLKPCELCHRAGKRRIVRVPHYELAPLFQSARVPVDTKVS